MSTTIKVEDLVKVYAGNIKAIQGISFDVKEGEIFGFLGPNGAGKSTTIMILTTLIKPTAGQVWVAGLDVIKEPNRVRLSLGYVSQEVAVDDNLSGREIFIYKLAFIIFPKRWLWKGVPRS